MVVQLGSGGGEESDEAKEGRAPLTPARSARTDRAGLAHACPILDGGRKIPRLRGRPSGHDSQDRRQSHGVGTYRKRRRPALADRSAAFRLDLRFEEERLQRGSGDHAGNTLRTRIHVAISPAAGPRSPLP